MNKIAVWLFVAVVLVGMIFFIVGSDLPMMLPVIGVKEPIVIGAIQPLTKSTTVIGNEVREGIEMAVDDINAEGGIGGRPMRVIFEDDQCDTKIAVTAIEKLVGIDKVRIIIGPTCSSNVLAVAPIANERKAIVITTIASTDKITTAGDYVFRTAVTSRKLSYYIAEFAYGKLGARTASVLYLNLDNGIDYKNTFAERFTELGGRILNNESYEKPEADFRAQLTKIKNSNPDVIFIADQINHGLAVKQARELGLKQQIIGPKTMESADLLSQAGTAAEGIIFSTEKLDDDTREAIKFQERYAVRYNKMLTMRASGVAYDTVMLVASLLRKCGGDAECVKNGLYATKNYPGVSGMTTIDGNGDAVKPLAIKTIKNGKFVEYEG